MWSSEVGHRSGLGWLRPAAPAWAAGIVGPRPSGWSAGLVSVAAVVLLAVAALCRPEAAWGQARIPRHVDLGVLGGATLSDFTFTPSVTQEMARGYTMGVAVRYTEEQLFGVQVEALLTRRGWRDRYDLYPELSFERDLFYVEVPAMAHIYFECGQKSEVSVDLGPKIGFYLGDKVHSNLPDDFGEPTSRYAGYRYKHHTLDVSRTFDYGIQMGLGYELKLTRHVGVQVQGRYYFGLGNIFPDAKGEAFETSNNHHIQIVAALWWRHWVRGRKVPASF